MRCVDLRLAALAAPLFALLLASCGGNSSETTITGGGVNGGSGGTVVSVDTPTGPNTTEIVVDSGPASGFSLGAANIPYVTVTVCAPGSAANCVTIDHVFLDTGSIGLRLLKSKVASLSLPALSVPADVASGTPAGRALECYPFVLGAVWGALASADVRIAGEAASSLPVHLIDDATPMSDPAPADCIAAANGGLQNSVTSLQANGILGIGMVAIDCGVACRDGNYASGYTLYYSCPGAAGSPCTPAALPIALQVQNPVAHFAVNNNGTVINLPALPDLGAGTAKGRLVFGIGTQTNNQIPLSAKMYFVDPNPANASYLYFTTRTNSATYVDSYIDSGSNALFFDDASIAKGCQSSTAASSGWYCPASVQRLTATVTDAFGATGTVNYSVANADVLFSTSSVSFAGLAGSAGQGASAFVWGLPFFYGRSVFTSIWGQALSPNGPWNAF
ncbi:MAG: DUF3443 family protein [Caldimonas sp.]